MNNFVRNQLDLNLVDICLGSILQISRKSLSHFVSKSTTSKSAKLTGMYISLNFHWISIILASEYRVAYALFKTRQKFENQTKGFALFVYRMWNFFGTPGTTII